MKHVKIFTTISLHISTFFLLFLCLFLSIFVVSLMTGGGPAPVEASVGYQESDKRRSPSDNPNVVTGGLSKAADELGDVLSRTGTQIQATGSYIGKTAAHVGGTIISQTARGISATIRQTASITVFIGKHTANITVFTYKTAWNITATLSSGVINAHKNTYNFAVITPAKAVGSFFHTPLNQLSVSPSLQIADVPFIDPQSPKIQQAIITLNEEPANNTNIGTAATEGLTRVRWPLEGRITTQFGVPHWPYQPIHTGIDISNQTASGVTPVYPFRAGRVLYAVESSTGLGNHVIVDHGSGLTSVYGHLASIAVSEGQPVTIETELGRQGTTGVSTGVHLHFEIRIDDQVTNPLPFLGA